MLSEFQDVYQNRHEVAKQWKQTGRRVFGYYYSPVPEELMYAAGILPVQIIGSMEATPKADMYLERIDGLETIYFFYSPQIPFNFGKFCTWRPVVTLAHIQK